MNRNYTFLGILALVVLVALATVLVRPGSNTVGLVNAASAGGQGLLTAAEGGIPGKTAG